jgi:nucleoside-diphosphate-sugar epimerase
VREAGHDVVGVDAGWFADCVLGPSPKDPQLLETDIRDVTTRALGGIDAVVHLAALSSDPVGELDPDITYMINHRATVRLATAAREAGVRRFLYASTCSVYGAADTDAPLDESAPLAPVTAYASSKVLAEQDLHALADDDFVPVYLRNATAFGYSPRMRLDVVLNDLVASAYLAGVVRVTSDGTPWRPLVHVHDIAVAFLAMLDAPANAVRDTAFNVGGAAANLRVSEIAEVAAAVTGAPVEITGDSGPDPRSYRVSCNRIRELLPSGWPQFSVERGASELASAYRRHALTDEDYRFRFKRLPHLCSLIRAGHLDAALRRAHASDQSSVH